MIKFCGDEIGELCPPMFAARAMASYMRVFRVDSNPKKQLTIRQGAKDEPWGSVRRIGYNSM